MGVCSRCGADTALTGADGAGCPACMLRLGLAAAGGPFDLADRYRILAPIGRGPDATVYLAQAVYDNRRFVTLKVFEPPVHTSRFAARVRDLITRIETCEAAPHLTILDAGILGASRACVVARYVPGMAIDTYFQRAARRRADGLPLFARVCRLVSQLHASGIVHGSIKASNIIVAPVPEGAEPTLLDAGLRDAVESSLAGFASGPGAPRRRAPDRRTDLAGLRALAADLFGSPRTGTNVPDLIQALARREFKTASELAEQAAALGHSTRRTVW